jgi:hypothetical protein
VWGKEIIKDAERQGGAANLRSVLTERRRRDPMSAEDNKVVAHRHWDEVWNTGNVAMVDEIGACHEPR